jgi:hypothetical protein
LADLSALLEIVQQQAERAEAKLQAQRQVEDKLRAELCDTRLEARALAAEMKHSKEMAALERVQGLQVRLQAMHEAQLLTDELLFSIEDMIADCADTSNDERVSQLIVLSTKMVGDATFARQLRRRFA